MKIALAQMAVVPGQPGKNLSKIARFIRLAKKKRAQVIVFPEDCITGPAAKRPLLDDRAGAYKKFFQNLAQESNIDIVTGSWIERIGSRRYNTCYYIDRRGRVLARYRKINLWLSERRHLTTGNRVVVFPTRFGKAGLAICWDLADPLLFREMARCGARIVYCPSWWFSYGTKHVLLEQQNVGALCHARALENELAVVYVNAAGTRTLSKKPIGHSQLVVPLKGAIARLPHAREELRIARLDLAILKRAAKLYKIRQTLHANP